MTSRENEPSAFAWIFGSVLGLAGAAAAIFTGVVRRRRRIVVEQVAVPKPSPDQRP